MSTLPFPPNVRRMNQEAYGSPQKGSCSSGLLEEGTPVIQASKNELRLKCYFGEAVVSGGQSPCCPGPGGAEESTLERLCAVLTGVWK